MINFQPKTDSPQTDLTYQEHVIRLSGYPRLHSGSRGLHGSVSQPDGLSTESCGRGTAPEISEGFVAEKCAEGAMLPSLVMVAMGLRSGQQHDFRVTFAGFSS